MENLQIHKHLDNNHNLQYHTYLKLKVNNFKVVDFKIEEKGAHVIFGDLG